LEKINDSNDGFKKTCKNMKLKLGFSPCPNDTFIFDALLHGKVETEGLEFEVFMEDVEALNQKAFRNELDISKLSYHAFGYVANQYVLLDAGSALGNGCGPLLIGKKKLTPADIATASIAIPGKYTTAHLLFSLAYPQVRHKAFMVFSEIEPAILANQVDAGVIIHENRFTYPLKNLVKTIDLGDFWEQKTGLPIPLGGIAIKRSLPVELQQKMNRVLRRSVAYAFQHPASSQSYVRTHAQEMETAVMAQHIQLYVNDYTLDLGEKGRKAVEVLFETAYQSKMMPNYEKSLFLT
jgi:1,4-dihydroxy-6-naphthoate synthase